MSEYFLNCIGGNLKQAIKNTLQVMLKIEMKQLKQDLRKRVARPPFFFALNCTEGS
jgi:hypothetical protein